MTTRRGIQVVGLLVVLVTLTVGCGGPDEGPLESRAWLDEHRWLGAPVAVGNLVVWPVHTNAPLDVGEFLTLEEAEAKGLAVVREMGGDAPGQQRTNDVAQQAEQVMDGGGAVVNTLVVKNDGDLPILVCAGTIVKGGQQDRQIGQDFVIASHSEVSVDAFCVEPGRWSLRSGGTAAFSSRGQGVAVKAVRASAQYEKDQGKVWDEVREVLNDTGVQGTDTLVAAREQVAARVVAERKATMETVIGHFDALKTSDHAPVGFAYAVDGKPVTIRAFAHRRLLDGHLGSFVQAMCLEAELAARNRGDNDSPAPEATADDVIALVKGLNDAEQKLQRTRAANWNGYRVTDEGFNGSCYLAEDEDGATERVVVTVDWTAK